MKKSLTITARWKRCEVEKNSVDTAVSENAKSTSFAEVFQPVDNSRKKVSIEKLEIQKTKEGFLPHKRNMYKHFYFGNLDRFNKRDKFVGLDTLRSYLSLD